MIRPEDLQNQHAEIALTERQAEVYAFVTAYRALTRKPCPVSVVAERFQIHHEAVRGHFAALARKGWLSDETRAPRRSPIR